MSVKLVYKDIAVGSQESASVTASGTVYSTLSLLPYGADNDAQYATFEHNAWILDGEKRIKDSGNVSFWSSAISNSTCGFSANPTITILFDRRYSSPGVSINFKMFPVNELNIRWYRSNSLLDEKTFFPNNIFYFCENAVESFDKVTIEIVKTWLPFSRVQIDSVVMGIIRTFTRQDFRTGSIRIVQEVDPTSRELAANVLDWTLVDHNNVEYMFQKKQPVEAYDGETLIGTFYIKDSKRRSGNVYDIDCTDAIGILGDDDFPDNIYTNKNAYDLALEICEPFEVDMADGLKSQTVTGILKGKKKRQALQQLCFAIGAVADTSGTDKIRIFRLPVVRKEIPASRVRTGGNVTTSPLVTRLDLTAHQYSTVGSGEEVVINGVKYYDTTSVESFTLSTVNPNDKQNVVSISDATLISENNVIDIGFDLFSVLSMRNTYNGKFRVDGEKIGDRVSIPTSWGTDIIGTYRRASIVMSGITVSDAEVMGF